MYLQSILLYTLAVSSACAGLVKPQLGSRGTPTNAIIAAGNADAASRTCTVSSRTPSPTAATCGQSGSVKRPQIQTQGTTANMQICRNGCLFKNPDCVSYSYDFDSGQCVLYTNTIKGSGFVPDATSTNQFWHRVCWQKRCAVPPAQPPNGATAQCGNKICGQAILGQQLYKDQYLVECAQAYDSTPETVWDATDFFDCIEQCDQVFECTRASFDHTLDSQNCLVYPKSSAVDGSLIPSSNLDSFVVAGTQFPDNGFTYRGYDDNYDTATCPAPQPQAPALTQCDTEIQSDHGPDSCYYKVKCSTKYTGTILTTLPTSTFFGCLDICDKNLVCDSVTWEQDSQTCTILLDHEVAHHDPPFQADTIFLGFSSAKFVGGC